MTFNTRYSGALLVTFILLTGCTANSEAPLQEDLLLKESGNPYFTKNGKFDDQGVYTDNDSKWKIKSDGNTIFHSTPQQVANIKEALYAVNRDSDGEFSYPWIAVKMNAKNKCSEHFKSVGTSRVRFKVKVDNEEVEFDVMCNIEDNQLVLTPLNRSNGFQLLGSASDGSLNLPEMNIKLKFDSEKLTKLREQINATKAGKVVAEPVQGPCNGYFLQYPKCINELYQFH